MNDFDRLVSEQLKTMDNLLCLQAELEKYQEIERELKILKPGIELETIQNEIISIRKELKEIHQLFDKQTEQVIRFYQENKQFVN